MADDRTELGLLERAEKAMGEALLESDTVERYSLNKYAELLIKMALVKAIYRAVVYYTGKRS